MAVKNKQNGLTWFEKFGRDRSNLFTFSLRSAAKPELTRSNPNWHHQNQIDEQMLTVSTYWKTLESDKPIPGRNEKRYRSTWIIYDSNLGHLKMVFFISFILWYNGYSLLCNFFLFSPFHLNCVLYCFLKKKIFPLSFNFSSRNREARKLSYDILFRSYDYE